MASKTNGTKESRPTLPPIRSLNLPFLPSRPNHDNLPYCQPNSQHYQFNYRLSTSSSSASSGSLRFTTWPSSTLVSSSPSGDVLLEACTLDIADAIVVVSPPTAKGQSESANVDRSASESKFFLVGPALDRFRQVEKSTPIPRGTRVYPYRVIRVFSNNQGRSIQHAVNDNSRIRAGSSSASDVADSSRSPSPQSFKF